MLHISRCALTRRTLWHKPHVSSSFLSKVIGKKRTTTRWRHNVTSDDLSTVNSTEQRAGVSWVDLMRIRGTSIFYHWLWDLMGSNGRVMKMTRPEVTDIKNPRYTHRRYLCPYCTLRVSKSWDLWCVFDKLSNFEKCNLRSGHLTLARKPCFATFAGVGGGGVRLPPPLAFPNEAS